jgi:type VI secretion system protein ImpG
VNDSLLYHYNRELAALRRLSAEFVRAHPAAAERLRLSADAVEDPHVSRLLEGVALLNARIREKIDDEFPELTDALLDQLYPHYLAPIPSMAIVEFACQKDLAGPVLIPPGTEIETEPVGGEVCRFSTAQPLRLWPVAIEEATLMGRPFAAPASPATAGAVAALRLKLSCRMPDQSFAKLGVESLRFFLRGTRATTYPLHELICNCTAAVAVARSATDPEAEFLAPGAVAAVGFGEGEGLLPAPARSVPGYRLLSELFTFPEKFLFFDVCGLPLKSAAVAGANLQLYVYLNRSRPELERLVNADAFALNCAPIINVFPQRAEPIRLTGTQSEYRVIPDVRRPDSLEVYAIDRVTATSPDGKVSEYRPFFATTHAGVPRKDPRFWYAARRPSETGSALDCFLALVDLDLDPDLPANWVLSVETRCTNRDLPARLPFGGGHPLLRLAKPLAAVSAVTAMTAPTATLRLPTREQGRWRLISHLLLNHLSVVEGEAGADALKEMLRLYDFRDSSETRSLIDAILDIKSVQRTARVRSAHGALCRGIDIEMNLSDTVGPESGIYLVACVLERVFALQASINSFTRLSVTMRGKTGPLYRWPARAGNRPLL